uniref:Essential protein Yae1 N-terminal domain-containing protein n=1 Tax=Balaenoptera musculus TaxID=9771 RepID=A0A8C0C7C7_BALMU
MDRLNHGLRLLCCSERELDWPSPFWFHDHPRPEEGEEHQRMFPLRLNAEVDIGSPKERFHGEGYQEGYEEGSSLGMIEGRQYGTLHGARIGSEIGWYQGFAFAWKCLLHRYATEKDSKKMKVLELLIGMIQKFSYDDPTYDKLHEDLKRIRGKFKQLCSLLNVQPDFKISAEGSGLSF